MQLSARNQFKGKIKSLKIGAIMAEVVIEVNGLEIVAAVTRGSIESLGLKVGDEATAVIKATEVMVARD